VFGIKGLAGRIKGVLRVGGGEAWPLLSLCRIDGQEAAVRCTFNERLQCVGCDHPKSRQRGTCGTLIRRAAALALRFDCNASPCKDVDYVCKLRLPPAK
jgi:hypothetical protein